MGNTKSVDAGDGGPVLTESNRQSTKKQHARLEKQMSQAASDTALNRKSNGSTNNKDPTAASSSSTTTASASSSDLKTAKKKAEANRSTTSLEGKSSKQPNITNAQRQILKYCINNSKDDLGERIFRRVADKRDDFRIYFEDLPKAERAELTDDLRQFVVKVVEAASDGGDGENLEALCRNFGERYAHQDFKPDFVSIANAMTTECVFLDGAAHATTETLTAWSQLTSTVFSLVRDGYYAELRRLRRVSNSTTGSARETEDPTTAQNGPESSATNGQQQQRQQSGEEDRLSSKSNESGGQPAAAAAVPEEISTDQPNNRVRFDLPPPAPVPVPQFLAPPETNF